MALRSPCSRPQAAQTHWHPLAQAPRRVSTLCALPERSVRAQTPAETREPSPSSPPPSQPSQPSQQDKWQNAPLEQHFKNSFTMSQAYVKDRPAPVPLTDFEARRKKRDLEEICVAGKRKGVSAELLSTNMNQVDVLIPGLVNLHKAKASDWVVILSDLNGIMTKLILLKELFPAANLHKILASQPKLLLNSEEQLRSDASKVRRMLTKAPEPDAIIEAVPDLMNPITLSRSLAQLQALYKGCDPVELLVKNPTILLHMGEATVEAVTDYDEEAGGDSQ